MTNQVKCLSCGYVCIENNIELEKKMHEEYGHPFKGDSARW